MNTKHEILSTTRINRLRAQGYTNQPEQELTQMSFGIRFAYRACVALISIAMITESVTLFTAMLLIAIFGVILPNHPFDYFYNRVLSKWMNKPAVPKRSFQLKFACSMASIWLAGVIYLLTIDKISAALILAGTLAAVALLPSTIDLCLPSLVYNALFQGKAARVAKAEKLKENLCCK